MFIYVRGTSVTLTCKLFASVMLLAYIEYIKGHFWPKHAFSLREYGCGKVAKNVK
jgi:hypothetical protein